MKLIVDLRARGVCVCFVVWWIKKLEFWFDVTGSAWLHVHSKYSAVSIWHSIPKTHETEQLHTC